MTVHLKRLEITKSIRILGGRGRENFGVPTGNREDGGRKDTHRKVGDANTEGSNSQCGHRSHAYPRSLEENINNVMNHQSMPPSPELGSEDSRSLTDVTDTHAREKRERHMWRVYGSGEGMMDYEDGYWECR